MRFKPGDVIIRKERASRIVPRIVLGTIGTLYQLELQNDTKTCYTLDIDIVDERYEEFPLFHTPLYQAMRETKE